MDLVNKVELVMLWVKYKIISIKELNEIGLCMWRCTCYLLPVLEMQHCKEDRSVHLPLVPTQEDCFEGLSIPREDIPFSFSSFQ
jgi:hypothetical protein